MGNRRRTRVSPDSFFCFRARVAITRQKRCAHRAAILDLYSDDYDTILGVKMTNIFRANRRIGAVAGSSFERVFDRCPIVVAKRHRAFKRYSVTPRNRHAFFSFLNVREYDRQFSWLRNPRPRKVKYSSREYICIVEVA